MTKVAPFGPDFQGVVDDWESASVCGGRPVGGEGGVTYFSGWGSQRLGRRLRWIYVIKESGVGIGRKCCLIATS